MSILNNIDCPILAKKSYRDRIDHISPTPEGWAIGFRNTPYVALTDRELRPIRRVKTGRGGAVRFNQAGTLMAISSQTYVALFDSSGTELFRRDFPAHQYGGSGLRFVSDNIWYFAPKTESGVDDELLVVSAKSGEVVARHPFPNAYAAFGMIPLPKSGRVHIEFSCGQDGQQWYVAKLVRGRLQITDLPYYEYTIPFLEQVSPNGRWLAGGAFEGDAISLLSASDFKVKKTLSREAAFNDDPIREYDFLGYVASFLDDRRLLVRTEIGRMLLVDSHEMRVLGSVWPEGVRPRCYGENLKPTSDPAKIFGWETDIGYFRLQRPDRLLVDYKDKQLLLLDLTPVLSA